MDEDGDGEITTASLQISVFKNENEIPNIVMNQARAIAAAARWYGVLQSYAVTPCCCANIYLYIFFFYFLRIMVLRDTPCLYIVPPLPTACAFPLSNNSAPRTKIKNQPQCHAPCLKTQ